MKCEILKHEWKEASNGNVYCQLVVKEMGDEWAQSFKYNFFCNEDVRDSMEAKFPKVIYLVEIEVPTPSKFIRYWATDGSNHVAGEAVARLNRTTSELEPIVFDHLKVVCRALPDGKLAKGENAEAMMMRTWNTGLGDGTIEEYSDDGDDDFAGTSSDIGEEPPLEEENNVVDEGVKGRPTTKPTSRPIPGRR